MPATPEHFIVKFYGFMGRLGWVRKQYVTSSRPEAVVLIERFVKLENWQILNSDVNRRAIREFLEGFRNDTTIAMVDTVSCATIKKADVEVSV